MAPGEGGWRFAGSTDRNLAEYFSLEALFRSVASFSLSPRCASGCALDQPGIVCLDLTQWFWLMGRHTVNTRQPIVDKLGLGHVVVRTDVTAVWEARKGEKKRKADCTKKEVTSHVDCQP